MTENPEKKKSKKSPCIRRVLYYVRDHIDVIFGLRNIIFVPVKGHIHTNKMHSLCDF